MMQHRNTSQHHDAAPQHRNASQHHDAAPQQRNTSQRKPHIPLQPPVHYVCPVINKNKQIMNGENDGIHGRQTRYSDGRPDKDEDRGTLGIPAADRQGRSLHLLPLPGGRSNEKHEIPGCRKAFQDGERSRADSLEHRRHKREGKVLHHRRRDRCPQPDSRRTGRGGVRTQRSRRREPSVAGPLRGVALR